MYFAVMILGFIFQLFNKRIFFFLFAIILALMGFFRYGIGIDYFAYEFLYSRLQTNFIDEIRLGMDNQEVGFRAIGSFLKGIGFSYQSYLIVVMGLNMIFMYKICKKYSLNPTLSLLLFFCFYYLTWTFSGIRQGIVIAVGIYFLLKYIEDKKVIKLILVSILLSLIHFSALILIFYYFLSKVDFKKSTWVILTVLSIIVSFLPLSSIINGLTFLPFYSSFYTYIDSSSGINILDFKSITRILFLIIVFIFYDYYTSQNEMNKKIMNLYIISMIFYFLFQFSELAAARLSIYGRFLDIIIFANILYLYKESMNKLIYLYTIFILCSAYLFKEVDTQIASSVESNSILAPYPTVFTNDNYDYLHPYERLVD